MNKKIAICLGWESTSTEIVGFKDNSIQTIEK